MEVSRDISNHLFYTTWLLLLLQMGKIIGSAFYYYDLFIVIIDIAFDCALILFSIGIIRIGKETKHLTNWKISSILIFSASFFDIITIILSFIFVEDSWIMRPLIIIRLILILLYLIASIVGFAYIKLLVDSLENLNIINRKGRFFISIGYILQLYPYLAAWSSDWVLPKFLPASIENTALVVFLLASFALILGFLELVFTMKILREGFVPETDADFQDKELEINDIDSIITKDEDNE